MSHKECYHHHHHIHDNEYEGEMNGIFPVLGKEQYIDRHECQEWSGEWRFTMS